MTKALRGGIVVTLVAASLQLASQPASAQPYAPGQPNLCKNRRGMDTPIKTPFSVTVKRVHGTEDYTANRDGYSLRTCYWKAEVGYFTYMCPKKTSRPKGWYINAVGNAEYGTSGKKRLAWPIVCDGTWQLLKYKFMDRKQVHIHLQAPSERATLGTFSLKVTSPVNRGI